MATRPSMDVYYNQGPAEYQKQLALYDYEQGDTNAAWNDTTFGHRFVRDYLKDLQNPVYATTPAPAQTPVGQAANDFTTIQNGVKIASNAESTTTPRLSTPQFAAQFQSTYGRAPTQAELRNYIDTSVFPQGLTPSGLTAATSIPIPAPPPSGLDQAGAMVTGAGTALSEIIKNLTPSQTDAERREQGLLDQMANLVIERGQQATDQLTAEQNAGLPQLRQQFADINAQILSKSAEYNALQIANQNRPITMDSIIGSERAILNARASDIGLLQARALGLQGQIEMAQATVDRAIDLRYQNIQSQLEIYQAQLNALRPVLDREEKIRADAQQILLDERRQALEDDKNEQKSIQGLVLSAIGKGITNQRVLGSISSARTYADALQVFARSVETPSGGGVGLPGEGGGAKDVETPIDPVVKSWVDQINAGTATISSVPAALRTAVVSALSSSKAPIDARSIEKAAQAQQQVDLATSILNSRGLSGAVGPSRFARFRPVAALTGSTANFIAGVEQLTNQQTLNNLLTLKQAGGTLGALNESELIMLQNSATKINNWALRDKTGKVYAYQANQVDFIAEINRIKALAEKAVVNSGVNIENPLGLDISNDPLELL